MNLNFLLFIVFIISIFTGCSKQQSENDVVIENQQMRLVIGSNGKSKSLIHKPTGQECLQTVENIPVFSLVQYRPYDNEIALKHIAAPMTFPADSIHMENNKLIVTFKNTYHTAIIDVNVTDDFIGFTLKAVNYNYEGFRDDTPTDVDEFTILQLPVKKRKNFGAWLNVAWDEEIAVNLLSTGPYTKITGKEKNGYCIMKAMAVSDVQLMNTGAALIVTSTQNLLDNIDKIERAFNLPLGVKSRQSEYYNYSYYEVWGDLDTENIDEHIAYAKQSGFKAFVIYYRAFAKSMGHFPWMNTYPGGIEDLKLITKKIKQAGLIPGFHIHYSKVEINDPYVTPVPDGRLNLRKIFTLANDLDAESTEIVVEENPKGITMDEKRRVLKIGEELIKYESFTNGAPYKFLNCKRGFWNTQKSKFSKGYKFGLLDVDTWPIFIRLDQNTSIQQEIAERVASLYDNAGFEFLYFDGAEDVPPPYWYNVPMAQLKVYRQLKTKPAFSEGALKSHFNWHILSRANAFDVFAPEKFKNAIKHNQVSTAKLISNDFTKINFGWLDYRVPSEKSIGMQPDMYEYACSRAAAWDCPISLIGRLEAIKNHPRTGDNLEVIKRWEEVRLNNELTEEEKAALKNVDQEHILILNDEGEYELYPYERIDTHRFNDKIRVFLFEKNNKTHLVYWHTRGNGRIKLNTDVSSLNLYEEENGKINFIEVKETEGGAVIPADKRRILILEMNKNQSIDLINSMQYIE